MAETRKWKVDYRYFFLEQILSIPQRLQSHLLLFKLCGTINSKMYTLMFSLVSVLRLCVKNKLWVIGPWSWPLKTKFLALVLALSWGALSGGTLSGVRLSGHRGDNRSKEPLQLECMTTRRYLPIRLREISITDFSRWSEVVDEILEGHDNLGETDVLPKTTVSSVRSQRLQCSEHIIDNISSCVFTETAQTIPEPPDQGARGE